MAKGNSEVTDVEDSWEEDLFLVFLDLCEENYKPYSLQARTVWGGFCRSICSPTKGILRQHWIEWYMCTQYWEEMLAVPEDT
jgi:hypothetical protein